MRLIVTGVATALMAAIGYVAEILAALGLYPSCVDTPPPGPPSFLLASAIIVLVCGGVPVLFVGWHRRGLALLVFGLGAVVPLGITVYLATRTGQGFCI